MTAFSCFGGTVPLSDFERIIKNNIPKWGCIITGTNMTFHTETQAEKGREQVLRADKRNGINKLNDLIFVVFSG